MDRCVMLLAVFHETKLVASAIILQVRESGSIQSSKLAEGETYEYEFSGYPNNNELVFLNVTRMQGLRNGDFNIYDDSVDAYTPCQVFQNGDNYETSPCKKLWKQKFGSCVSNRVTTEHLKVSFRRRGKEQILEVDFKIIDCASGGIKQTKTNPEKPEKSWKSAPADDQLSIAVNLATILPIVFSASFVVIVLATVVHICLKKPSFKTARGDPEEPNRIELEMHVYEEITELPIDAKSRMQENPYNHLGIGQHNEYPKPRISQRDG